MDEFDAALRRLIQEWLARGGDARGMTAELLIAAEELSSYAQRSPKSAPEDEPASRR